MQLPLSTSNYLKRSNQALTAAEKMVFKFDKKF